MDATETLNFVLDVFQHTGAVDEDLVSLAMTRARVVDIEGRAPIDPDWTPTFDEWMAAAEVAERLHLRSATTPADAVKQFTSEGATFVFAESATDWLQVANYLRSRSPLAVGTGWAMVEVPSESPRLIARSEVW